MKIYSIDLKASRALAHCIMVGSLFLALSASADLIVDLGSAKDITFLDVGIDSSNNLLIQKGTFTGNVGWASGTGTRIDVYGTLDGDIYHKTGSTVKYSRGGRLLGAEIEMDSMQNFIDDVDAAVAQFASFNRDIYLGNIQQTGNLTIDRTDEFTVVDLDALQLSSGTLTLNGQADDIFYIRVSDLFDLSNVDVVINGTDASRVFFIYTGSSDFTFDGGDFQGNIIAPEAAVVLSKVESFGGSVISGNGFSISGKSKNVVFTPPPAAVPEASVISLITLAGGGSILIRRSFKGGLLSCRT